LAKRLLTLFVIVVAFAFLVQLKGDQPDSLDFKLYEITASHSFNLTTWMVEALLGKVGPGHVLASTESGPNESDIVRHYFDVADEVNQRESETYQTFVRDNGAATPELLAAQTELQQANDERAAVQESTENVLSQQISAVLSDEGFSTDLAGQKFLFPPVEFKFERVPNLLIISRRDRIGTIATVPLYDDLTLQQIEDIESRADQLGVSALVVPLGGLGTYPTMIPATSSLDFVLQVIPHEWAHNYFTLRPVGFKYALGEEEDYEVITINETAANIVGQEIGREVHDRYYPDPPPPQETAVSKSPSEAEQTKPAVDFNAEMRQIRLTVNDFLSQGKVDQAEKYMESEREYLVQNGYAIRKLNQAYFSFYGSYADGPTSVSPIGGDLAKLRAQSVSLKDFVDKVSQVGSYADLKRLLK
jgi:hypothetical protein